MNARSITQTVELWKWANTLI